MPHKARHRKQSSSSNARKEDFRASLKIIGWLNQTLDEAAKRVSKKANRDSAIALLILHRNRKAKSGKKLLRLYGAWQGAPGSGAVERSLLLAVEQLLRAGLVTVGEAGGLPVPKIRKGDPQGVIDEVLSKGLTSLRKIKLTEQAPRRIERIRRVINEQLERLRTRLAGDDRRVFDKLIKDSLPYPPKLSRLKKKSKHG